MFSASIEINKKSLQIIKDPAKVKEAKEWAKNALASKGLDYKDKATVQKIRDQEMTLRKKSSRLRKMFSRGSGSGASYGSGVIVRGDTGFFSTRSKDDYDYEIPRDRKRDKLWRFVTRGSEKNFPQMFTSTQSKYSFNVSIFANIIFDPNKSKF